MNKVLSGVFCTYLAVAATLAVVPTQAHAEEGLGVTREAMVAFGERLGMTFAAGNPIEGLETWDGASETAFMRG